VLALASGAGLLNLPPLQLELLLVLVVAHRLDLLLRPPLSLGRHRPLLALETWLLTAQPQVTLPTV
jgi:hypothetical protein